MKPFDEDAPKQEPMRKPDAPPNNRTPRRKTYWGPKYRVDRLAQDDSPYAVDRLREMT